jgi:anti-sigma factor RsiW
MHCDEFENRLNELLDRRIAPDDDSVLCSHASRCPQCADTMSAHLAVAAALKDLPPELPDETFPFAVMNRFENEPTVSAGRQRLQWVVTSLVTAAAILIALTLWRGGGNSPTSIPGGLADSEEFPAGYERLAEETQQLATLIANRQYEVMNELAEGIKPVANSFGAAYDALRRTLPGNAGAASATSG